MHGACQTVAMRRHDVKVWDTQYATQNRANNFFREGMSTAFMPWSVYIEPMRDFEGRIECISLEAGSIGRLSMTPAERARTFTEISNSPRDCIYANFVLSGEVEVEQAGIKQTARPGDLILYDSTIPSVVREKPTEKFECLQLMFDKSLLGDRAPAARNVAIRRNRLIFPVANGLRYLSDNLLALPCPVIASVFEALAKMMPIAILQARQSNSHGQDIKCGTAHFREITDHIYRNIRSNELSPSTTSQAVSISKRYLHKIFSASGTTFNTYVVAARLEEIARLLRCAERGDIPISALAHEFGFKDLTTFNRAFRKRFGCTPREYRSSFN